MHHQQKPFCLPISVHRVDGTHEDTCLPTVINSNALFFAPLGRNGIAVSRGKKKKGREITFSRGENPLTRTPRLGGRVPKREDCRRLSLRKPIVLLIATFPTQYRRRSYNLILDPVPLCTPHASFHFRRRSVLRLDSCRNHGQVYIYIYVWVYSMYVYWRM